MSKSLASQTRSLALATVSTILLALTITINASPSTAAGGDKRSVPDALLLELNTWLDAETEFARIDTPPHIVLVHETVAERLQGNADHSGGRTRGLYDPATATIYLTKPWSADNRRDVSVLLHELLHHRQSGRHWYCQQAQEWRAYQAQAQWLEEQGSGNNIYWPAIVLQSSCTKRDIHPE